VSEDVDDLAERLDETEGRSKDALSNAMDAREEVAKLRSTVDRLVDRVDELEEENRRLRDRTDLLQQVREASSLKPDERAAVIIQTLINEAHTNEASGHAPKAKMDTAQAKKTLGGAADRGAAWRALQRAEELVCDAKGLDPDNDNECQRSPVRYVKRSRSAKENSHLLLDLRDGDVPAVVAGYDVHDGGAVAGD